MAHRPATSAVLAALDTMAVLYRRSPTSLPRLKGKVLAATVLPGPPGVSKFVEADVGFKANVTLLRSELAPACDPETPYGRAALAAATAAGSRHALHVEHVATPLGEMALDAERAREASRGEGVWREIETAFATGTVVQGRLLNAVNKGFAVGVGGLVAFLPERMAPYGGLPQAGALHPFFVVSLVPETRNVVLSGALPARIAATLRSRERAERAPRFQVVTTAQQNAARDAQRAAVLEAEAVAGTVREARGGRVDDGLRRAAEGAERAGRAARRAVEGVKERRGEAGRAESKGRRAEPGAGGALASRVITSRARRVAESGTSGTEQ